MGKSNIESIDPAPMNHAMLNHINVHSPRRRLNCRTKLTSVKGSGLESRLILFVFVGTPIIHTIHLHRNLKYK